MSKLYRYIYILLAISLFLSACTARAVQPQKSSPEPIKYADLLGKPLNDEGVMNLLANHHCTGANHFQLCKDTGVALWLDTDHIVREIYLYLNSAEGFAPYKGELPLGLKFYDTLGAVEYKLRKLEANRSSLSGNNRMNYEGRSPDHMRYWVTYNPYDFTVIYNTPFLDEDATIYAVLLHS